MTDDIRQCIYILEWDYERMSTGGREAFKSIKEHLLKDNKCLYCGKTTISTDPDILCKDCTETFGHAKYSEL